MNKPFLGKQWLHLHKNSKKNLIHQMCSFIERLATYFNGFYSHVSLTKMESGELSPDNVPHFDSKKLSLA